MVAKNRKKEDIFSILANKKKIIKAMRIAIEAALLQHKRAGNSIVVWQNGKAVWIPPEKIVVKKRK